MHFPVVFHVAGADIPAHLVFEGLGYLLGYGVHTRLRSRDGDDIPVETRWSLLAGAAVGAVAGAKLLGWLNHPLEAWAHRTDWAWLAGGKTIVGGLLGGHLGVAAVKRRLGERRATGDLFVLPLCVGMAVGRVGCFLAGLPDHTCGNPTSLPWGVDFGDGIRRHPAQLYEVAALGGIAAWAWAARARVRLGTLERGDVFRGFMTLYLAFRLALEAIKPEPRLVAGLCAIQLACLGGLLYHARVAPRLFAWTRSPAHG
ncbi:MAG TPA: prolipoprotein diacylglyceryl transferase family protein [Candidatus Eisenbacteria bacterium]|nr:prolipoprotein diacylglyceryl transferase family protein [Candidatus Eisenbacteria bacterium]